MSNTWIQTFKRKAIDILNPNPDDFHIEDIAHSLSMQCRFNGHTKSFYSVCEHSLLVASLAPDDLKLTALMHDASEAYLSDLPRPIKRVLPDYKRIESNLEALLAKKYNLVYPYPEIIKEIDLAVLMAEQIVLMGEQVKPWPECVAPAFVQIKCYTPSEAKTLFLQAFIEYSCLAALTLKEIV